MTQGQFIAALNKLGQLDTWAHRQDFLSYFDSLIVVLMTTKDTEKIRELKFKYMARYSYYQNRQSMTDEQRLQEELEKSSKDFDIRSRIRR